MIKTFSEYLGAGVVKKVRPDPERAKSLIKIADRKINSLGENIRKVGISNENANDYIEYCYDLLMAIVRARMLLSGLNASGQGAHEAEVSYLHVLDFKEKDVQFLDRMRYFRNGMLYYGTILDKEYAEEVIKFTREIYSKLR